MSWVFSARLGNRRRVVAVCAATAAVLAGGVAFGARQPANATVLGSVSVADVSANEGDSGSRTLVFEVVTSGVVLSPETVHYKTVDGTAKAGDDYVAAEGDLSITQAGTQNVTIQLVEDAVVEPDETFTLELSGGSSNGDTATGTIVNDDFELNVADVTLTEADNGTSNAAVVISLAGGPRQDPTTVQYSTVDGTAVAPGDYTAVNAATATIPGGASSVTVNIPVVGDALYEDNENFHVTMSNPSSPAKLGDSDGVVTITNNDPVPGPSQQPKVSIGTPAPMTEGHAGTAVLVFPITLDQPAVYTTSVAVATSDGVSPFPVGGSATAPSDYTALSGSVVTFAPGETSNEIGVIVKGDALFEFNEQFTATLSNPSTGLQLNDAGKSAAGTITNDDDAPELSVDAASANEGANLPVTVRLSEAAGTDIAIRIRTQNGTALAPGDYTSETGRTVFISAGSTTSPSGVFIATKTDALDEPDETFQILASRQAAPGADAFVDEVAGTATITDATAPPTLTVDDVAEDEGNSGTTTFDFTVTLTPVSARTVTVNYTVGPDAGPGAAVPGSDFTAATGQVSFGPGETSKTVSVAVAGDTLAEDDETFKVTLSGAQNATITDGTGLGTINNDDGAFVRDGAITTGAGAGGGSHVKFFTADNNPVGPGFFGTTHGPGVRVARGDLDGDGHDEVIVSSGPGGSSLIRAWTPDGSALLAQIEAYPGFTGGVSIAAADVDNDGKDEIITGAGPGGGPHVRTFKLTGEPGNRSLVGSNGFFGLDTRNGYSGGVNVAGGDVDGDGKTEIVTSVVSQLSPIIGVWRYNPNTEQVTFINFFLAFDQDFRGGVNIAVGDLDGDDKAEIVAGAGPGGGPHVKVLSGSGGGLPGSSWVYDGGFRGGVNVAVGDIDGDGANDIVTGTGPGGGPHVRAFDIDLNVKPTSFMAYDDGFRGGVNVAVGKP